MAENGFILEAVKNSYSTITGSFDVLLQDSTATPFHYYLMDEQSTTITLSSAHSVDSIVINVSSGHGFSTSSSQVQYMSIFENNIYTQQEIKSVSTNAITISTPLSNSFTTDAIIIRGIINLGIDASSTNTEYVCKLHDFTIPIDIQTIKITMTHSTAADYSRFGGISSLTNGVYFRKENDINISYGNYKSNDDFSNFGADIEFHSKAAPASGLYGTKIKFDIKDIYGIVIRLDPNSSDIFSGIIRDSLSGLTSFRVSLMGQYTVGE